MSLLERNLDKAIALGSEYLYKTCLTGPKAEEAFARVLSQQKLNMEQQFIRQATSTLPCVPPPTTQWSMP